MEVLAAELLTLPRSRRSVAPRSLHRMFFTSPLGSGINAISQVPNKTRLFLLKQKNKQRQEMVVRCVAL